MDDSQAEGQEWSVDGRVRLVHEDGSASVEALSIAPLFAMDAAGAAAEALQYYRALQAAKGVALARLEWDAPPQVTAAGWFDR